MNFTYSPLHDPPAPMMDIVVVASPTGMETASISAFVDSGADATLIPTPFLEKIGAAFVDDAFLRSQWGERRRVRLYLVDIRIGRLTVLGTTVVGDELSTEVILGRDVLNRLRVILDGPQQRVQVR